MLKHWRRSRPEKNARAIREESMMQLPGTDVTFLFQRDGCRTLRMAIRTDGSILVKAPAGLSIENVFSFMLSRLAWIRSKRDFFVSHKGESPLLKEGQTVLFLGRPFLLCPVPRTRGARAELTGHALKLPCPGTTPSDEAVERAFRRWRRETARLVLGRRLARMERRAQIVFNDSAAVRAFAVRSLKRRWGSCSVRGDITLAEQLIAMPLPLIDYVICHELCHLRAMNHGPSFHALLRLLLPDAGEREKRIHIWSLEHPR